MLKLVILFDICYDSYTLVDSPYKNSSNEKSNSNTIEEIVKNLI